MTKNRGARNAELLPRRLVQLFARNGYTRGPSFARVDEGHQFYKKGWEVRLVLRDRTELDEARRLLERAGLRPGKVFQKHQSWIQPVYGRTAVERFNQVRKLPHDERLKGGVQRRLVSLKVPLRKR
ncbi:MAG: hypothetical protein JNL28_14470 [Planctomycetes bacterium]|nr:hypothetical protein [Planctomycetota bacterium]